MTDREDIEDESATTQVEDTGFGDISDEEFLKQYPSEDLAPAVETSEETPEGGEDGDEPNADQAAGDEPAGEQEEAQDGEKTDPEPIDYKALYEATMAPFKANGRDFVPQTPEDVRKLAQMGANYTKKMQALAPNLRIVRMLENQGLLDESKINFLIDIAKKDKGAISKLLVESEYDPLDHSADEAQAYQPKNYTVSDQEIQLSDVIADVMQTDIGKSTVHMIQSSWDLNSKKTLAQNPQLLSAITQQRENGIFDTITAEIDRERMLGNIPVDVSFMDAYTIIGDRLNKAGQLVPRGQTGTTAQPQPTEVRPVTRQQAPVNADKARAAAATRSTPRAPARRLTEFDILNMSDEEIKAMASLPV